MWTQRTEPRSARPAPKMDISRSVQEGTALREAAYVIRFGHFPGDTEDGGYVGGGEGGSTTTASPPLSRTSDSNDVSNPFGNDTNLESPSKEELNPFDEEEGGENPFEDQEEKEEGGVNPFEDKDEGEGEGGRKGEVGVPSPGKSSHILALNLTTSPSPPIVHHSTPSTTSEVTRAHAEEVVAGAFNVTQRDLRSLVDDVAKNQEEPRVEVQLEDIRTEGLQVTPTPGDRTPPFLFFKASIGDRTEYTAFSSTSATNTTRHTLSISVTNMYTEQLTMEMWSAQEVVTSVDQTVPKKDMFGRFRRSIRRGAGKDRLGDAGLETIGDDGKEETSDNRKDETGDVGRDRLDDLNGTGDGGKDETGDDGKNETGDVGRDRLDDLGRDGMGDNGINGTDDQGLERTGGGENGVTDDNTDIVGVGEDWTGDGVDHSDETPVINTSLWDSPRRRGRRDGSTSPQGLNGDVNGLNHSGQDSPVTSTPASVKQKRRGLGSIGKSLRASLRRGLDRTESHDNVSSPRLQRPAPDTVSIQSDASEASVNPLEDDEAEPRTGENGPPVEEPRGRLERSLSQLSVASLTQRSLSVRRSAAKATANAFRRIGSLRERGNRRGSYSVQDTSSTSDVNSLPAAPADPDISAEPPNAVEMSGDEELELAPLEERSVSPVPPAKAWGERWRHQRTLRSFRGLRTSGVAPIDEKAEQSDAAVTPFVADNPSGIADYLASLGRQHLKAHLLGRVTIPIKDVVGTWHKDSWFPMTMVASPVAPPRRKGYKTTKTTTTKTSLTTNGIPMDVTANGTTTTITTMGCACRLHVRLALPLPRSAIDDTAIAYETFRIALQRLVDRTKDAKVGVAYRGEVGPVGDVVLQQLTFFTRVPEQHITLARWLVMSRAAPRHPDLLYDLLVGVRDGLAAGVYVTGQRREISRTTSWWSRQVVTDEFEALHSAFPATTATTTPTTPTTPASNELLRLEYYLRCFRVLEESTELRVPLERELGGVGLENATLTDLLLGGLSKHVETWIDALNKEQLKPAPGDDSDGEGVPTEWMTWRQNLRRAAVLTNPILSFLAISHHTYQPIFRIEMEVDYLYLAMPKLLTAAVHLVAPLVRFEVDGIAATDAKLPDALQSAWWLCENLSEINKISIKCELATHLFPSDYRRSFAWSITTWLSLSRQLSAKELLREVEQDEFEAIDDNSGYSQSAVGCVDLLRALMGRLKGVSWPGGVGPGGATLDQLAGHVIQLVSHYTICLADTLALRCPAQNQLSMEVCVVLRNIEWVCDETRRLLVTLSQLLGEPRHDQEEEKQHKLQERSQLLQTFVDDSASKLLRKCVPRLERVLEEGVVRGGPGHVQRCLESVLEPVRDRLYFAEPLLHALWIRLFEHATFLANDYARSGWRERLRELRRVMSHIHTFLTNDDGVGFHLPPAAVQDFETFQAELMILGATSPELVAHYYTARLKEQDKASAFDPNQCLIVNVSQVRTGLRVHVVQGPGHKNGVLVKARLEPQDWFPKAEPLKTSVVKRDPAVFDQVLEFSEVNVDSKCGGGCGDVCGDGCGGVLVLTLRTPRILGSSVVHSEAIVPLRSVHSAPPQPPHTRLPLTRPWKLTSYKPLEALRTRALDRTAVDFLRALSERWEGKEGASVQIQDSQKLRASFARAGSLRSPSRNLGGGARRAHGGSLRVSSKTDAVRRDQ